MHVHFFNYNAYLHAVVYSDNTMHNTCQLLSRAIHMLHAPVSRMDSLV